jgi:hypothetical protein
MSLVRAHWYRLVAILAGSFGGLLAIAVARADDGWHP